MTFEELKLRRLQGQHLLQKTDTQTVVKDLCGIQAQYLSHALHALSIRCQQVDTTDLVKSWTNRGTMHLFSEADLPLFLYRGRPHHLRPVDTMESDACVDASRKAYFASVILEQIASGIEERDVLRAACEAEGMNAEEAESIFNPWGGLLRALCEEGHICHQVQEKKSFRLCPPFEPMDARAAQTELLRRYFTNFGPATVRDASYFFGWPQSRIKALMTELPLEAFGLEGRIYYHISGQSPATDIPACLFLAGFDQLLLGYEKTENPFLPQAHIRDIFTLAGSVRPAVLVDGTVAGSWNLKGKNLTVTLFADADPAVLTEQARILWPELNRITVE